MIPLRSWNVFRSTAQPATSSAAGPSCGKYNNNNNNIYIYI